MIKEGVCLWVSVKAHYKRGVSVCVCTECLECLYLHLTPPSEKGLGLNRGYVYVYDIMDVALAIEFVISSPILTYKFLCNTTY